jgi:hypothetical protein
MLLDSLKAKKEFHLEMSEKDASVILADRESFKEIYNLERAMKIHQFTEEEVKKIIFNR